MCSGAQVGRVCPRISEMRKQTSFSKRALKIRIAVESKTSCSAIGRIAVEGEMRTGHGSFEGVVVDQTPEGLDVFE
jgi:hypothetical protein